MISGFTNGILPVAVVLFYGDNSFTAGATESTDYLQVGSFFSTDIMFACALPLVP